MSHKVVYNKETSFWTKMKSKEQKAFMKHTKENTKVRKKMVKKNMEC